MNVELLYHTPDPERAVATAARLCYAPVGASELMETLSEEKIRKVLTTIMRSGHHSTLEHASYTFAVDGISRACSHQLVRHRLASYNQQSQRYVTFKEEPDFILPASVVEAGAQEEYEQAVKDAFAAYDRLVKLGIPAEDARYLLPNACETKIVITMNIRELLHFFSLRCCTRAQWEIRALANEMLRQVKEVAPVIFENAGPTCVSEGVCHEGEMSCGRLQAILAQKAKAAQEGAAQ